MPITRQFAPSWLAVLLSCAVVGCGRPSGPQRAAVGGKVTVDGVPLSNGLVQFVPVEGNTGPVAGGSVVAGRYDIARDQGPVVGKNRVEILGTKTTGEKTKLHTGEVVDKLIDIVPPQYNTQSTLVREIQPGENELDFDLKAGK